MPGHMGDESILKLPAALQSNKLHRNGKSGRSQWLVTDIVVSCGADDMRTEVRLHKCYGFSVISFMQMHDAQEKM